MRAHGELTYCPKCGKEVYPASQPCRNCGYAGEELKRCPKCDDVLKVLLFLGVQPDGYVCEMCKLYFSDDLKTIATMI